MKLQPENTLYLLVAILLLSGCAGTTGSNPIVVQDIEVPFQMHAEGRAQQGIPFRQMQESNASWSLSELIVFALDQNPTLQQARLRAQVAEARSGQATSRLYPTLGIRAEGSSRHTRDDSIEDDYSVMRYGPAANLNWLLLDFGGRRATRKSANLQLRAENALFNKAHQDLVTSVQRSYFDLVAAEVGVEVAEAILAAAEQTLEAASRKRTAGLGIELDVLQARAGQDRARHTLESARGTLQVARGTLAAAIGLPADTILAVAPPNETWESNILEEEQHIHQLIELALRQRPDVAALAANRAAQEAALAATRSSRWPSLVANASASRYANRYSGANLENRDTDEYLVALALDWNLFDGGLRRWQIKEAQTALASAELALHAKTLSVSAEVWRAFHTWQSAWQKMNYSKDFLETAQTAFDLASRSYESGLRDIISLLNAQANLASARTDWVYTRRELHIALADLANAIGDLTIAPDGALPQNQAP